MNDAELLSFCNEMIGKFKMLSDLQKEMQYELIDTKFTEWELKKLIFALDVLRTIADRPQEWIPCSEREPKIGEKVLVSTKKTCFVQVFKGIYSDPTRWLWEHNSIKKIDAWMPLPKPWKGADDE